MITSRMIYGSGTPTDLSRVNATRTKRQYALRSASAPQGRTVKVTDPEREQARLRLEQAKLLRQLQREHEREIQARIYETVTRDRSVEQYN